jgi:signal transduction histidine kinase
LAQELREFDQGIKQAAHMQLTNVLEEVQGLTREATAYLESNVAEARATVQTAASEAISEFRRQTEIHATVTATDTTQRITSALAALDAEHRAACDARRNAIQSDVARSTEQVTEQFRQGLRAFFYSCLVAAVGAVEQHSQATREGLSFDAKNFLPPAE